MTDLTTDYDELANHCLYQPRKIVRGNIYGLEEDKSAYNLICGGASISIRNNGIKLGRWNPYPSITRDSHTYCPSIPVRNIGGYDWMIVAPLSDWVVKD